MNVKMNDNLEENKLDEQVDKILRGRPDYNTLRPLFFMSNITDPEFVELYLKNKPQDYGIKQ